MNPLDVCYVSVPQFSEAMAHVLWAFALGGVLTVVFGGLIRQGVFLILIRLRIWRRFDRAMTRLFRRDRL